MTDYQINLLNEAKKLALNYADFSQHGIETLIAVCAVIYNAGIKDSGIKGEIDINELFQNLRKYGIQE